MDIQTNVIEGDYILEGARFAIVSAKFNNFIVDALEKGAVDTLKRHGTDVANISIYKVPGAFELPLIAKKVAQTGEFDAIIVLGAVIRGSTPHFDYVCSTCATSIAKVSLELTMPIIFGVLTTENIEQAIERAGTKSGNKGSDAALSAIEMVSLIGQI